MSNVLNELFNFGDNRSNSTKFTKSARIQKNHRICAIPSNGGNATTLLRSCDEKHGYIGEFEYVDDHRYGEIVVELNGRLNKCGVISPRFDVGVREIEPWTARLLPRDSSCNCWWKVGVDCSSSLMLQYVFSFLICMVF